METIDHELLDLPIKKLEMTSEAFRQRAKLLKFKTVRDIMNYGTAKLKSHPYFDACWHYELNKLLRQHGLDAFVEE